MEKLNIDRFLNPRHKALYQNTSKNLLVRGGYGAGKSFSLADKTLLNPLWFNCKFKSIVIRKTLPSLKKTCIPLLEERAQLLRIPYRINRSEYKIKTLYGSEIQFLSMNSPKDYDKIKSLTDIDFIWLEEPTELTEEAYDEIDYRLRGGNTPYAQIAMSFNPVSKVNWMYERFYENSEPDTFKLKYTVEDNPFLMAKDPGYIKRLDALKSRNISLYNVRRQGEWGVLEGTIYEEYDIVDEIPEKVDEIIYALDFGYNNPCALVKIYICDNEFYIEELIYRSYLKTPEIIQLMKSLKIDSYSPIYCDSQEPARIQEIADAGFNAKKSDKSVKDGILFCKAQTLHIVDGSENVKKEVGGYVWAKDKNGKNLDEPVKFQDHACDAFRYGIYTHCGKNRPTVAPPKNQRSKKTRSRVKDLPE